MLGGGVFYIYTHYKATERKELRSGVEVLCGGSGNNVWGQRWHNGRGGNEGVGWIDPQPLTAVAGFRDPRLRLIRSSDSPMTVNWHVIRVYLIAPEMKQQVVYELLLVSVAKEKHELFERRPI